MSKPINWLKVNFERDITLPLLNWANNSARGLFLKGPRQVGKTHVLKKLGENQCFSGCVYVDLRDDEIREWLETNRNGIKWYERFKLLADNFTGCILHGTPFAANKKIPLIILDEIQESPKMFNRIRDIINEQKVKLAVSGSYLGIAEFENRFSSIGQAYFSPVGDVEPMEMKTLTYRETVRLCKQLMPEFPKEEIFARYFRYGGYPAVIKTWLRQEDKNARDAECRKDLLHIYKILMQDAQRYINEPLPQSVWDRLFIGVAQQIEKKQDIIKRHDQQITYKLRIPDANAAGRDNKISMMEWMLACNLLWNGEVTGSLNNLNKISKRSYYFADQGLLFLAFVNSVLYPSLPIDRGNMPGILAENFVALALSEFMVPLSYAKTGGEIDFLYKKYMDKLPDSIEVKYSGGNTITSDNALRDGKVKRIIKIQGNPGQSTDTHIIYPIRDIDNFGVFLGYPDDYNMYSVPELDF